MAVPSALLIKSGTPENLEKHKELWKYLKETDKKLYMHMRLSPLGLTTDTKTPVGRKITTMVYNMSQKIFGFN